MWARMARGCGYRSYSRFRASRVTDWVVWRRLSEGAIRPFDDASGQKLLITSLPLPLLENGKLIAVLGMDISLANQQGLISQFRV